MVKTDGKVMESYFAPLLVFVGGERKLVVIILLIMAMVSAFNVSANTGIDPLEYDYSSDFERYREIVSVLGMGRRTPDAGIEDIAIEIESIEDKASERPGYAGDEELPVIIEQTEETDLFTVIAKTDGVKPDIYRENLVMVIRGPENHYTLYYSTEESAEESVRVLSGQQGIVYAELDSDVVLSETDHCEETLSFHSWGAERMAFGEYIPYISTWGNGSAVVAVIDSGVYRHPLIIPHMPESGYDYVDADSDATNDLHGHGTHVAGIVVDCTAIAPVCIYPIRVLNENGRGKMSNFINAIIEAREQNVDVINLSVEASKSSTALDTEIISCMNSGIVVVAAAGNGNIDASNISPGHLTEEGIIIVGSADYSDGSITRAAYSNYGSSVDLYAFGTGISSCSTDGGFVLSSGTSMATPHVSGMCALMRLLHPEEEPSETEERIRRGSQDWNGLFVPSLDLMIPREEGFYLQQITLGVGENIPLPEYAQPSSSWEQIEYISSDNDVLFIENGNLIANGKGSVTVTISCMGFGEASFSVIVDDNDFVTINLPSSLQVIEEEALSGVDEIHNIILPPELKTIGVNAFNISDGGGFIYASSIPDVLGKDISYQAVMICPENSMAELYAKQNNLQYIVMENAA